MSLHHHTPLMGPPTQSLRWRLQPDPMAPNLQHSRSGEGCAVSNACGAGNGYDSISNTTRKALVQLVTEQNLSVRKASKILQIKYTTAKALVQKFRNSGNIDRQRARRMTFEDDQKEKFRKDLIKVLPIDVQEDSDDERWGFTTNTSSKRINQTNLIHHHLQQNVSQAPLNPALVLLQSHLNTQGGACSQNQYSSNGRIGRQPFQQQPNYLIQSNPLQAEASQTGFVASGNAYPHHHHLNANIHQHHLQNHLASSFDPSAGAILPRGLAETKALASPLNLMANFQPTQSNRPANAINQLPQNFEFANNLGSMASFACTLQGNRVAQNTIRQSAAGALPQTQASNLLHPQESLDQKSLSMINGLESRLSLQSQNPPLNPKVGEISAHQRFCSLSEPLLFNNQNRCDGSASAVNSGFNGILDAGFKNAEAQQAIVSRNANSEFTKILQSQLSYKHDLIQDHTNLNVENNLNFARNQFCNPSALLRQGTLPTEFSSPHQVDQQISCAKILNCSSRQAPQIIRPVPKIATPLNHQAPLMSSRFGQCKNGSTADHLLREGQQKVIPEYIVPLINNLSDPSDILMKPPYQEEWIQVSADKDVIPITFVFEPYSNSALY